MVYPAMPLILSLWLKRRFCAMINYIREGRKIVRRYILQAIELAHAGRREEAVHLLRAIVRRDPSQIVAWKWLGYLSPHPHEALAAAQQVLRLDPADEWARQSLPALVERARRARAAAHPAPRRRERWRLPVALILVLLLIWVGIAGLWAVGRALPTAGGLRPSATLTPDATATFSSAPPAALTYEAPLESSSGATDRVAVSINVKTYRFEAGSLPAVQRALYTLGPKIEADEGPAIAATAYSLQVDWEAFETPQECRVGRVTVRLSLTYTYPEWIPEGSPQPALYEEWERFMEYVVAHEEHHGEIALGCAYELADQVEALATFSTCTDLQSALNSLIESTYAACEARQAAFDEAEGEIAFPLPHR